MGRTIATSSEGIPAAAEEGTGLPEEGNWKVSLKIVHQENENHGTVTHYPWGGGYDISMTGLGSTKQRREDGGDKSMDKKNPKRTRSRRHDQSSSVPCIYCPGIYYLLYKSAGRRNGSWPCTSPSNSAARAPSVCVAPASCTVKHCPRAKRGVSSVAVTAHCTLAILLSTPAQP